MARRSSFTTEQKAKIVAESNEGTLEEVATKHGISVPTLSLWRRDMKGGRKSSKKKTGRKVANRAQGKAAAGVDIGSIADDLQLAAMFKGLIKQLGYVKR